MSSSGAAAVLESHRQLAGRVMLITWKPTRILVHRDADRLAPSLGRRPTCRIPPNRDPLLMGIAVTRGWRATCRPGGIDPYQYQNETSGVSNTLRGSVMGSTGVRGDPGGGANARREEAWSWRPARALSVPGTTSWCPGTPAVHLVPGDKLRLVPARLTRSQLRRHARCRATCCTCPASTRAAQNAPNGNMRQPDPSFP